MYINVIPEKLETLARLHFIGLSWFSFILIVLLYADDVLLINETVAQTQRAMKCLLAVLHELRMAINDSKTNFALINGDAASNHMSEIEVLGPNGERHVFERVQEFKYLGVKFASNGQIPWCDMSAHMKWRSHQAIGTANKLSAVSTTALHSIGFFRKFYNVYIRSVLLYASQIIHWQPQFEKLVESQAQLKIWRHKFGFPRCVPHSLLRIVCGIPPMEAMFAINNLVYFHKLRTCLRSSYAGMIASEIIQVMSMDSHPLVVSCGHSFVANIQVLLQRYDLFRYWDMDVEALPQLLEWKKLVTAKVLDGHYRKDLERTRSSTIGKEALKLIHCDSSRGHYMLPILHRVPAAASIEDRRAMYWFWTFLFQNSPFEFNGHASMAYQCCVYCDAVWSAPTKHLLLDCEKLLPWRPFVEDESLFLGRYTTESLWQLCRSVFGCSSFWLQYSYFSE
jgi:hypothetical protein